MNHTKQLEDTETLEYHYKRWETIAGSHFMLHDTQEGKFYPVNYIVRPDHLFTFFNLTGISFQFVDFIHELIKLKNPDALENTFIVDYKEWLHYDDTLFSTLSNKIMSQMMAFSTRI